MKTMTMAALVLAGLAGTAAAGDKDKDKPAPADKDKAPAATMEMPKPPAEVADMAKAVAGTWKCTGKVHMPNGVAIDATGQSTSKLDLDKMWIHTSWVETKSKQPYKFEAYVTFDAMSKKWTRVMVDNMGAVEVATSDGDKSGVITWDGSTTMMGMSLKSREVRTKVSDKEIKMEGTMSMDGKTYNPSYEMECKK